MQCPSFQHRSLAADISALRESQYTPAITDQLVRDSFAHARLPGSFQLLPFFPRPVAFPHSYFPDRSFSAQLTSVAQP